MKRAGAIFLATAITCTMARAGDAAALQQAPTPATTDTVGTLLARAEQLSLSYDYEAALDLAEAAAQETYLRLALQLDPHYGPALLLLASRRGGRDQAASSLQLAWFAAWRDAVEAVMARLAAAPRRHPRPPAPAATRPSGGVGLGFNGSPASWTIFARVS